MAYKRKRTTEKYSLIGIHKINGDKLAIKYLYNAYPVLIENLFFMAKKYGKSGFVWDGDEYEIVCRKDLSFTVYMVGSEEEKEIKAY